MVEENFEVERAIVKLDGGENVVNEICEFDENVSCDGFKKEKNIEPSFVGIEEIKEDVGDIAQEHKDNEFKVADDEVINGDEFAARYETVRLGKQAPGSLSLPIRSLIYKVQSVPQQRHIFRGINHPGLGAIFGVSKGGKTTVAENLLMMISAGQTQFLGEKLYVPQRRVLFVSLEEYYTGRTQRNSKQLQYIKNNFQVDDGFDDNYFVVDDNFPRYMHSEIDWRKLENEIKTIKPSVVVIDSLSRLTLDAIEDSTVAIKIMKRLRQLAYGYGITLIIIHHSHKLTDQPLIMANMAGSRIVSQELDFILGVNRLSNGSRYIKDIAYRYYPDDSDKVLSIRINDDLFVEEQGFVNEYDLIRGIIPPELNPSDDLVIKFFTEHTAGDPSVVLEHKTLFEHLVVSGLMSKTTMHACLRRLKDAGIVKKNSRGEYTMPLSV